MVCTTDKKSCDKLRQTDKMFIPKGALEKNCGCSLFSFFLSNVREIWMNNIYDDKALQTKHKTKKIILKTHAHQIIK